VHTIADLACKTEAMTDENKQEEKVCTAHPTPTPEADESVGTNQEPVQEESELVHAGESPVDEADAPPQESEAPSGEEPPLTQGQRDVDRVIGVLLGESEATGQETSEPAAEDQGAAQEQGPAAESQAPPAEPQPEYVPTVESVLEAILFATDEPLTDSKLAGIVETSTKQVRESIDALNAKYAAENHAFRIEQIAGGYQMLTLNTYNSWLKKMLRARSDNKLSPAAMETLAIIAYKQPIIRADIEAIRGVAVGEVIRSLMYKGLVKITGRAEILGRPMLYGTTKKFLEIFGLNSLKDLPKAEELKNPDRG
jgi:segregation and condensation protein B